MSSLRFNKAPPKPDHIDADVWEAEWVGLSVGLASVFPLHIGYLGAEAPRVWDDSRKVFRDSTPSDSMNFITNQLVVPMWISRGALIHTCKYSTPPRPTILSWLEEEGQKYREMFAVPDSVADYLP